MVDRVIFSQQQLQGQTQQRIKLSSCYLYWLKNRARLPSFSKNRDQRIVELRGFERFVQEGGELDSLHIHLTSPQGRQQNQGQRLTVTGVANVLGQHRAVHVWHLHIQDGHIERNLRPYLGQCLLTRSTREGEHPPGLRLQREDGAVGGVIVHNQDALPVEVGLAGLQVWVHDSGSGLGQDSEMKGRTCSWLAFDPHAPAHELGQPLADRQPQTCPSIAPRRRVIHLAEGLEQARLPLLGNADACIPDREMQLVHTSCITHSRPHTFLLAPGLN